MGCTRMADRDKVIKGLTCCSNHTPGFGCSECPYECDDMDQCIEAITYDALELLTPVKPIRDWLLKWRCGNCQRRIDRWMGYVYCPECGRKVDWDD